MALGQPADALPVVLVYAGDDEAVEPRPLGRQHPEGAVPGVHVPDRRNAVRALGPHVEDGQHERCHVRALEPGRSFLFEHDWRDRSKVLAVLDVIQPSLHLRVDGRRQD